MAELTGKVLKGRYCILEQIGKGGSASVYLARDLELGILRAVKELPPSGKREARLLAGLEHDFLPKIVDYEENEQNCYIIMEYVKGESLGELLRKGEQFSIGEAAEIGCSLAQVLGYLHGQKHPVFYGDLKPDNVMRAENGKIYLIDLGSAVTGYLKEQKVCMGTEGFAAPEQYRGEVSALSDVYALGKTLEALLGERKAEMWLKCPSFAWVLLRCCMKDEKLRIQSMKILEKWFQRISKRGTVGKAGRLIAAGGIGIAVIAAVAVLVMITGRLKTESSEISGKNDFRNDADLSEGERISGKKEERDFYERLTEVTEVYYSEEFQGGSRREKQKALDEAEAVLKELLKEYRGVQEYRRIMNMLAVNREISGKYEEAALYYEQMLNFDGGFRENHGEYGMFLLRVGQMDAARELWKDYRKKEEDGRLDDSYSWNLKIWEKRMKAEDKKSVEKKKNKAERVFPARKAGCWLMPGNPLLMPVSAMQFGGFDVEVGVGEYPEDGSWEQDDFMGISGQEPEWPDGNSGWGNAPDVEQNYDENGAGAEEQIQDSQGQQWPIQGGQYEVWQNPPEPNQNRVNGESYGNVGNYDAWGAPALTVTPVPLVSPTPEVSLIPTPTPSPAPSPEITVTPPPLKPFTYFRKQTEAELSLKEETVRFSIDSDSRNSALKLKIQSKGSFRILSFRLDGKEAAWRWEKDGIYAGAERTEKQEIDLLILTQGGKVKKARIS